MDLIHYSHKENEMKTDGGVMTNETKKYAETYGGMAGAVLPLIIMMGTMIFMVAFGMRSTKNFWSAGYFAVLAGFLVYKDKKAFQKALIDGRNVSWTPMTLSVSAELLFCPRTLLSTTKE